MDDQSQPGGQENLNIYGQPVQNASPQQENNGQDSTAVPQPNFQQQPTAYPYAQMPPAGPSVVLSVSGGNGMNQPVPQEIRGWNWGAFFLTWIWSIANNSYLGLLSLIPAVTIVMAVILGIKGNEWAWQNRRFESVEQFKKVQRKWAWWGFAFFIVSIAFYVFAYFAYEGEYSDFIDDTVTSSLSTNSGSADLGDYYTDLYGEYRIQPPKDWRIDESQGSGELVAFYANGSDTIGDRTFVTNINIMKDNLTSVPKLTDYVAANKQELAKALTNYQVVSEESVDLGGTAGHLINATHESDSSYGMLQLYTVSGKTAYVITATTLSNKYDSNKETLANSLKSFRVEAY